MTDPVPSSLLRQEGPQQEGCTLQSLATDLGLGTMTAPAAYGWFFYREQLFREVLIMLETHKSGAKTTQEAVRERIAALSTPTAALSTSKPDLALLARLRDYHDQVLQGFRHISRVEEADLIQAAIDGLTKTTKKI